MGGQSGEACSEAIVTRLVVHVGPPKTATTYVQRGLFANADLLARHGVYLPKTARLELEPNAVCHHHLAWELTGSPRFRPDIGGWDALAAEVARVDAETVLLSSELLSRAVYTEGVGVRLNERLLSFGRDVTVVYVVRDQLSQINSYYAQQVKTLEDVDAFGPHVQGVLRVGEADLERHAGRWYRSADFDFVAVPFTAISDPNPLVAVLRAARIAVPEDRLVVSPDPVNITLGPVAVEAIRLLRVYLHGLNRSVSDDDPAVRRLHRIAARRAKEEGWCEEAFWGWPPALAARAAEQLGPSNERFAEAVWGTSWPLPLPVDRPQARAQLLKLPPDELDRVHEFVVAMAKRYATLRAGPSRA
jgi:hypothetical protein